MSICRRAFIHDFSWNSTTQLSLAARQNSSVASPKRNSRHFTHPQPFEQPQNSTVLSPRPVRKASTHKPLPDDTQLFRRLEALSRRQVLPTPQKETLEVGGITVAQYKALSKSPSTQALSKLSLESYLRLLDTFASQRSAKWLNILLRDILYIYSGLRIHKIEVITKVITTVDFHLVSPRNALIMTRFLSRSFEGKRSLERLTEPLIRKVSLNLRWGEEEDRLYKILQVLLMAELKAIPKPSVNVDAQIPSIIDTAFYFIRKLIFVHNQAAAFDIFQLLVELKYVPSEVFKRAPTLPDFEIVMMSTIIRSCIYWRKQSLALELLNHLLASKLSSDGGGQDMLYDLTVATVLLCLQSPTRTEMLHVFRLIKRVHDFFPVPDSVIRQFYQAASVIQCGAAAGKLYSFCRETSVQAEHHYPAPQGDGIILLMEYFSQAGYLHYVRSLVQEAIDGALHLPYHSRANFISIAVSRGIAGPARILWLRYSNVGDVIKGNPRLMIRMVSAFTHLSRKLAAKSPKAPPDEKAAARDCIAFAKHVLQEYRTLHHPGRATAHHFALNALARAYMIIGDFTEGFNILKILVKQRHAPDLADINVALGYFAEHSPVQAARLIELMIERGLSPNGRTVGTVIHWAVARGNTRLVSTLLRQARERGVPLTDQTVASLVRNLMAPQIMRSLPLPDRYQRLQEVLDILRTDGRDLEYVCSPHLGKYLVFASLRIGSGLLAFKFWSLLLKDREEAGDREQIFIQRLIRRFTKDRRVVKGMAKGD